MMIPTVHLNGTSRESLIDDLKNSVTALNRALEVMARGAPHARDYYPQGSHAYGYARDEHLARVTKINEVKNDLITMAEAVLDV